MGLNINNFCDLKNKKHWDEFTLRTDTGESVNESQLEQGLHKGYAALY